MYFSSSSTVVLILAALLPPLFLMYRVYRLDSIEKEPGKLLFKLFLFGVIATIPAIFLELILGRILVDIIGRFRMTDTLLQIYYILDNLVCVALVEEGLKFFFLKIGSWKDKAFNYRFDGVVYAVMVSLGFAAAENVLYVMDYGISNALMRAVTAIPGHCIFGIYMGTYYAYAKFFEKQGSRGSMRYELFKALAVPTILHGIYDYSLTINSDYALLAFFVYAIVLDIFAFRHIRRFAAEDVRFPHDYDSGVSFVTDEETGQPREIRSLSELKDQIRREDGDNG